MNAKQRRIYHVILLVVILAAMLCMVLQTITVSDFNNLVHTSHGLAETEVIYADLHARGNDTSSWMKLETQMEGGIYDVDIHNNSDKKVNSWTMRINIHGDCWLNQFWNGETEIHQHVGKRQEKTQQLNLASYDLELVELDYIVDGSDLLIPLSEGDYIIYHPSEPVGEMPIEAKNKTIVGMIFYQAAGTKTDLSDYSIDYCFHVPLTYGPIFIICCFLLAVIVLMIGFDVAASVAYRRAQKDIDTRVAGISCMTELYAAMFVIDLPRDTVVPVAGSGNQEYSLQKEGTADEKIRNLFLEDAVPEDQDVMVIFSALTTIPKRLTERTSISNDYISRRFGWIRARFIPMDKKPGKLPERILFTLQTVNDEKKETDLILEDSAEKKAARDNNRETVENISAIIQAPLRSILALNERILGESGEDKVLTTASEIRRTGEAMLDMVNINLDLSRITAGKMKLVPAPYDFRGLIGSVADEVKLNLTGRNIEFSTQISAVVPEQVIGDAPKLKQVITMLLSRTLSEIETGTIVLRVFAKKKSDTVIHLLISALAMGTQTGYQDDETSRSLLNGLLKLMDSELGTADLGAGRDLYFEVEQELPEETPPEKQEDKPAREEPAKE